MGSLELSGSRIPVLGNQLEIEHSLGLALAVKGEGVLFRPHEPQDIPIRNEDGEPDEHDVSCKMDECLSPFVNRLLSEDPYHEPVDQDDETSSSVERRNREQIEDCEIDAQHRRKDREYLDSSADAYGIAEEEIHKIMEGREYRDRSSERIKRLCPICRRLWGYELRKDDSEDLHEPFRLIPHLGESYPERLEESEPVAFPGILDLQLDHGSDLSLDRHDLPVAIRSLAQKLEPKGLLGRFHESDKRFGIDHLHAIRLNQDIPRHYPRFFRDTSNARSHLQSVDLGESFLDGSFEGRDKPR